MSQSVIAVGEQDRRTAVLGPALRNSGLANQGGWVTQRGYLLFGSVGGLRAAQQPVASLVIFALRSQLCVQPPDLVVPPRHLSPSHSGWRAEQGQWMVRNLDCIWTESHLVVAL